MCFIAPWASGSDRFVVSVILLSSGCESNLLLERWWWTCESCIVAPQRALIFWYTLGRPWQRTSRRAFRWYVLWRSCSCHWVLFEMSAPTTRVHGSCFTSSDRRRKTGALLDHRDDVRPCLEPPFIFYLCRPHGWLYVCFLSGTPGSWQFGFWRSFVWSRGLRLLGGDAVIRLGNVRSAPSAYCFARVRLSRCCRFL